MKKKPDYSLPSNPLRFDMMALAAELAVLKWGRYGMTLELAHVAMQGFNHVLCDHLKHGGMEIVEKIISYNEIKGGATPSILAEDHYLSKRINISDAPYEPAEDDAIEA